MENAKRYSSSGRIQRYILTRDAIVTAIRIERYLIEEASKEMNLAKEGQAKWYSSMIDYHKNDINALSGALKKTKKRSHYRQ
jgi:hypothetical protein